MKKSTLMIAAAAALIGGAAQAADFGDVYITTVAPKPMEVLSNGQSYTKLKTFGMANVGMRVEYTAGGLDRIKSWKVWPEFVNGVGIATPVPSLKASAASKSYAAFQRPKEVGKNVNISLPGHLLEDNAVMMCNWLANKMRNEGKTNKEIFGKDRVAHFDVNAMYEFKTNLGGESFMQYNAPYEAKVICKKWKGSQIPTGPQALDGPLEIKKATMKLAETATMGGTCKVTLTTAISTNKAGAKIKYRYTHSSGKKSPIYSVKTAANRIAVVKKSWDVPNKPGLETGWFRLEGTSVGFKSNKASYRMDCKKKIGGFAPNKPKPKVAVPLGGRGKLSN